MATEHTNEHRNIDTEFESHVAFRTFTDGGMIIWQDEDRSVKLSGLEVHMLRAYLDNVARIATDRRLGRVE
jgi:hypothetical protein